MPDKDKPPTKFESWILASRPKTLLAAVVPVVVGSAVAIEQGKFTIIYSIVAFICATLIQVGTNFVNDYFDFQTGADNENRKGPKRGLALGVISLHEMKMGSIIVFSISFLLGLYLVYTGGIVILIIGVLSILAGVAYTAGPYPLAYNGLGDVFVFIFFGVVGTMGTSYLHTKEFSFLSFLASIPVGALITNILVVNNYRDVEEDKQAKKFTLAVILGRNFSRFQFIISLAASFIVPAVFYFFFNFHIWIFLPYITIPVAIKLIKMLYTYDGLQLNQTLELTAKFSALFGILFALGLAI